MVMCLSYPPLPRDILSSGPAPSHLVSNVEKIVSVLCDLTDAEVRTTMSTTLNARLKSKFAVYLSVTRRRQSTIKVCQVVGTTTPLSLSLEFRREEEEEHR